MDSLTHDLQTPLAAIMGSASSILAGDPPPSDSAGMMAANIYDEVKRLSRLVSNLLRLTRLESGEVSLNKEPQFLEEVGGAVLNRFEGKLRVDLAARQVFLGESKVHLTPNEYKVLVFLVRHAGKVVTHRQLLKEVWGHASVENSHYLRIYVHQLRHKLESDPTRPVYLRTEPGVEYRLWVG